MRIIITLAFAFFAFTSQASAQNAPKTGELTVKTEIFCSHCNHCGSCKPQIETALFEVTGVKQAKLDIATQTINVSYNPNKTSADAIKQAILSSGYAADGVQPTAEAHGKLEACCQRK